jgi:hypothetical protein
MITNLCESGSIRMHCRSRAEDAGANGFVSKTEDLRGQLKSTLDNLFSGDCESMTAGLVEASHESSCA